MNTPDKETLRRIALERRLARVVVRDLIASGHMISVYDGEEYAVKRSTKEREIIGALMSTDSDTLVVRQQSDGKKIGSVLLIWGNGCDVISDHSISLTDHLAHAYDVANKADRRL